MLRVGGYKEGRYAKALEFTLKSLIKEHTRELTESLSDEHRQWLHPQQRTDAVDQKSQARTVSIRPRERPRVPAFIFKGTLPNEKSVRNTHFNRQCNEPPSQDPRCTHGTLLNVSLGDNFEPLMHDADMPMHSNQRPTPALRVLTENAAATPMRQSNAKITPTCANPGPNTRTDTPAWTTPRLDDDAGLQHALMHTPPMQ